MMGIGKETYGMDMENKNGQMELVMKVTILTLVI